MRAVIQRVHQAHVIVSGGRVGEIGPGLVVFLGVSHADTVADVDWLVDKVPRIRCFEDENGRLNKSLLERGGQALVISQFTLFGNLRKGTRPSFNDAAAPPLATALYDTFVKGMEAALGNTVATGRFGAHMDIEMSQDGPVTLILDTKNRDF
jgi:D-tyrosyl-tRNA(Tyr) deacylase